VRCTRTGERIESGLNMSCGTNIGGGGGGEEYP